MPAESSPATGSGVILCTQPPMIRTIFLREGGSMQLAFPHVLYALFYFQTEAHPFQLKKLNVMWGQQPFACDPTEKVYGLPIRNHDGAFATCFYQWPSAKTAEEFIEKVVGQYWLSPFGEYEDWASFWSRRYKAKNPKFLAEWTQATKDKNYNYAMEKVLLQADYVVTLGKLLETNKSHYATSGVQIMNWNGNTSLIKKIKND